MATQNWARAERLTLSDLLDETGPDAPTLCQGWTTGDLVAHLLLRDTRPDASPGILVPLLGGYTQRVQRKILASAPFPELVERLRQGPPAWSPVGLPGLDASVNLVEFFVHHEDVRRARPGWETRRMPTVFERQLWRRLRIGRLALRRLPVEITLVEPHGSTQRITKGGRQARVHGLPSELTLWVVGRKDIAQVEITGEAEAVNVLSQGRWRL